MPSLYFSFNFSEIHPEVKVYWSNVELAAVSIQLNQSSLTMCIAQFL